MDTSNPSAPTPANKPGLRWYQFGRGSSWILVALVGALLIGPHLAEWGVSEYTQRWFGACLKVATGAWGGYRISRGLCRIDPSSTDNPVAFALMHLARAFVVAATVIGVTLAT